MLHCMKMWLGIASVALLDCSVSILYKSSEAVTVCHSQNQTSRRTAFSGNCYSIISQCHFQRATQTSTKCWGSSAAIINSEAAPSPEPGMQSRTIHRDACKISEAVHQTERLPSLAVALFSTQLSVKLLHTNTPVFILGGISLRLNQKTLNQVINGWMYGLHVR